MVSLIKMVGLIVYQIVYHIVFLSVEMRLFKPQQSFGHGKEAQKKQEEEPHGIPRRDEAAHFRDTPSITIQCC